MSRERLGFDVMAQTSRLCQMLKQRKIANSL